MSNYAVFFRDLRDLRGEITYNQIQLELFR